MSPDAGEDFRFRAMFSTQTHLAVWVLFSCQAPINGKGTVDTSVVYGSFVLNGI